MPRPRRCLIEDEPAVYHVMSKTCLEGLPLDDVEKDHFLAVLKRFAAIYFAEIIGFCVMGNHFHAILCVPSAPAPADEIIRRRSA